MGCSEIGAVSTPVTLGAGDPLTGVPIEEGTVRTGGLVVDASIIGAAGGTVIRAAIMSVRNTSARLRRTTGFELSLTGPPSGGIGTLIIGGRIGPPDPAAGKSADRVGRLDDILPNFHFSEVVCGPPDPVPAGKFGVWAGWLRHDQDESEAMVL